MAVAPTNKRVTSTMRPADLANLETIVELTDQTPNDAVRSALSTERFIRENLRNGSTMWFKEQDGTFREVVFAP